MKAPQTANKTRTIRSLDPNNEIDAALSGYAGRVHRLLSVQAVCTNNDLAASLDDFLGAIYAMIFANHEKFSDRRDRSIDITAVRLRAGQLAAHEVRIDGLWMAGFHFNSSLFRMAAVYHRLLQIVVGRDGDVPTLQTAAILKHGNWVSIRLHKVHSQVNELKHDPQGIYEGRLVSYQEALDAVGDMLNLIEAWTAPNIP